MTLSHIIGRAGSYTNDSVEIFVMQDGLAVEAKSLRIEKLAGGCLMIVLDSHNVPVDEAEEA